jgi:hypothetical protein
MDCDESSGRRAQRATRAALEAAAMCVETQTVGGNKPPGSASRVLLARAIRVLSAPVSAPQPCCQEAHYFGFQAGILSERADATRRGLAAFRTLAEKIAKQFIEYPCELREWREVMWAKLTVREVADWIERALIAEAEKGER